MLTAKREPFHPGEDDAAYAESVPAAKAGGLSRFGRMMGVVQIVGSLLAIPLGLASGYSIYRANFSVETTCNSLRANIIAMIDKKIDASARRILVRRDVETFEKTCGGIDPDAEAAFKTLLNADKAIAAAPRAPERAKTAIREAKPRAEAPRPHMVEKARVETKTDTKSEAKLDAKPEPKTEPKTDAKPKLEAKLAEPAAPADDTAWLAAVREALVTHAPDPADDEVRAAKTEPAAPPLAPPAGQLDHPAPNVLAAPAQAAPKAPTVEPPPPAAVAATPRIDPDHPVPPAAIDGIAAVPSLPSAQADAPGESRLGALIARIPLVRHMLPGR